MFEGKTIGFALTGSFCTLADAIDRMEELKRTGCGIMPIVSPAVMNTDTRFGSAADFIERIEAICGRRVISTIAEAEPIGPKKLLDALVVMPCTGNTLAKLYHGITDTAVTMACKSHLRNSRPLLIAVATNDGLAMNARNIGGLLNLKNVYLVPLAQDDAVNKPNSIIARYDLLIPSLASAFNEEKPRPQLG